MLKKIVCVVLSLFTACALLTSCGKKDDSAASATKASDVGIDVDITEKMYVTYINEIYNNAPDYLGKTIRIEGLYKEEYWKDTGSTYSFVYRTGPGCCGNDGATCGFEMVYDGKMPKQGDWIRVVGTLEEYKEGESKYMHLVCSSIEYPEETGAMTVKN